jgi:hypothetical protein
MSREAGGVLVIVAGLALMIAAINGSLQRAWEQLVTPSGLPGKSGDAIEAPNQPGQAPARGGGGGQLTPDRATLYYLPPGYPGSGVRTATG